MTGKSIFKLTDRGNPSAKDNHLLSAPKHNLVGHAIKEFTINGKICNIMDIRKRLGSLSTGSRDCRPFM